MRTRRSPRNQEILWKALGGSVPPGAVPVDAVALAERVLARTDLNPRTRRMFERDLSRAKVRRARVPR